MTIETCLEIQYGKDSYILIVKMIRIEPASYFFIRDKDNGKTLLSGKTLELTYEDSFLLTEFGGSVKSRGIPKRIVTAIQKQLLKNKAGLILM
ncbi:MAG: hypothetical protein ABI741_02590 [Ferruginibacter sp.]